MGDAVSSYRIVSNDSDFHRGVHRHLENDTKGIIDKKPSREAVKLTEVQVVSLRMLVAQAMN